MVRGGPAKGSCVDEDKFISRKLDAAGAPDAQPGAGAPGQGVSLRVSGVPCVLHYSDAEAAPG